MLYQLIYVSSIAQNVDKAVLNAIALKSQLNNRSDDITGVMLVHNGAVLQILEGDKDAVEALYEKIAMDPRHTQLMVMSRRKIDEREFRDWHMGFKYIEAESPESAIFKLTQESLRKITHSEKSDEVRAFSQSFARVSGF